jgi:hypothetical protein
MDHLLEAGVIFFLTDFVTFCLFAPFFLFVFFYFYPQASICLIIDGKYFSILYCDISNVYYSLKVGDAKRDTDIVINVMQSFLGNQSTGFAWPSLLKLDFKQSKERFDLIITISLR